MDKLFETILNSESITVLQYFIIIGCALLIGIGFAFLCYFKSKSSKNFLITLSLLPLAVAMVILLVNGNIGIGVAVAGAFGLVRFRSAQGNAKERTEIFIAMAIGLALGTGYIAYAVIFTLIAGIALLLFSKYKIFEHNDSKEKVMRITIPEDLDYNDIFNDLFERYTKKCELVKVKSTNMGSLFRLTYELEMIDMKLEKEFLDQLRCRNGNLEIQMERIGFSDEKEL
jgi:uncharacterized membrane protein YhiD involved in acid resistance